MFLQEKNSFSTYLKDMQNSDLNKSNKKPYCYINQTKRIQIIRLQIELDRQFKDEMQHLEIFA